MDSHEINRRSWNAATPAHNRHKGDQAAFLRAGGSTLGDTELPLLGDLHGQRLVHLQCNCGQDTLSLAGLGAEVVGVDISDAAIEFARALSRDAGIPATFHRADLFDWFATTDDRFDVAFASYGALGWLSDLAAYFRGVARVVRPGGRYVLVEFHPTAFLFDNQLVRTWPYSTHGAPLVDGGVTDYVGASEGALSGGHVDPEPFVNPHPTHEFAWGLADILGGALAAGLRIEHFGEYPYAEGCKIYDDMRALPGGRWTVPEGSPELPLMFSLVARR